MSPVSALLPSWVPYPVSIRRPPARFPTKQTESQRLSYVSRCKNLRGPPPFGRTNPSVVAVDAHAKTRTKPDSKRTKPARLRSPFLTSTAHRLRAATQIRPRRVACHETLAVGRASRPRQSRHARGTPHWGSTPPYARRSVRSCTRLRATGVQRERADTGSPRVHRRSGGPQAPRRSPLRNRVRKPPTRAPAAPGRCTREPRRRRRKPRLRRRSGPPKARSAGAVG